MHSLVIIGLDVDTHTTIFKVYMQIEAAWFHMSESVTCMHAGIGNKYSTNTLRMRN